jgi:hypothetical protein
METAGRVCRETSAFRNTMKAGINRGMTLGHVLVFSYHREAWLRPPRRIGRCRIPTHSDFDFRAHRAPQEPEQMMEW